MNRETLFHKTITTLNEAYRDGALSHGRCDACAVGNILKTDHWGAIFATDLSDPKVIGCLQSAKKGPYYQKRYTSPSQSCEEYDAALGMKAIISSGYTLDELMRIEFAFETCDKSGGGKNLQYNGLTAVFEVLADIHQVDISIKNLSMSSLNEVYATI